LKLLNLLGDLFLKIYPPSFDASRRFSETLIVVVEFSITTLHRSARSTFQPPDTHILLPHPPDDVNGNMLGSVGGKTPLPKKVEGGW
jgi:hypothetical protein